MNPLPFKIKLYRTIKIPSYDDLPKKLANSYFKELKKILERQYEKKVLVREFSISFFVFIDVSCLCYVCSSVLRSNVLSFRHYW